LNRLITISLILFGLAATALAVPQAEVPEAVFDFGHVAQGKVLTHTYWIRSVGDDTLRIVTFFPGCGCTEAPVIDSAVAPGDSIPLTINFYTGRYVGRVKKKPKIEFNTDPKYVDLAVHVTVHPENKELSVPVRVQPALLDVSQFGERPRRRAKFLIENLSDQDLNLKMVDSTLKSFEVKLPDKVAAGETVEGRIQVFEDKVETDFEESLTFKVTNLESATFTVPVKRMYRPDD